MIPPAVKAILIMTQIETRDAVAMTLGAAQMLLLVTGLTSKTVTETADVGVGRPSASNVPKTIATAAITVALGVSAPMTTGTAPKGSVGAPVIAGTAHETDAAKVMTTAGIAAAVAEIREIDEVTAVTAVMATATGVTTVETVAAATEIAVVEVGTADATRMEDPTNGSQAPYTTTSRVHEASPSPQRNPRV